VSAADTAVQAVGAAFAPALPSPAMHITA